MRNLLGAAITLAVGVGLAAAAQAQGSYSQGNQPAGNMPAGNMTGAPSTAMPNEPAGAAMQNDQLGTNAEATAPKHMRRHHVANRQRVSRSEIQQAQEQLKNQGLYHGRVDGRFGPQTRMALSQFQQQNGLQKTGRLDQQTLAGLMNGQTSGVGSSAPSTMPGTPGSGASSMTPPANPNPNAAGDNNNPTGATTPPSGSTGTNPGGSTSKY